MVLTLKITGIFCKPPKYIIKTNQNAGGVQSGVETAQNELHHITMNIETTLKGLRKQRTEPNNLENLAFGQNIW